ncbi:ABC transporter substrate-binding protein [Variovorax beijingensis]|uniref:ABC transporter substrate-binding protein n=1 Tax=Variovorax beijingensis TaxID=2496117 RepID=A0A3P3E1Z3_9BURK|nr:transporter substrate-binding domain-containing protein [Variovorax beijingensis]RRH79662.1 ABC transporter substrate-binding protein [Variovorax beijingensis]RSZ28731.1 transporter substrate-binding domain-containing protein [Variovorax beijingensis]
MHTPPPSSSPRMSRRACLQWAAAAGVAALAGTARAGALDRIRARGTLSVAIYQDMPPFHAAGEGIDIELARALAGALDVKLSLLPFLADENMGDDLRHMVWRGHYLGFGPADVLLHVPVDRPLMDETPQALIFAPYYRERVVLARRLDRLPQLDALSALGDAKVAVSGKTLAGWLMIGADNGAYRDQLDTQPKDGTEAARALQRGEVAAAAGLASEIESVLRGDARFAIAPLPSPRIQRNGWAVGMAVKKDATDLAQALQAGVNALAQGGRLRTMFEAGNVAWQAP